MLAHTSAKKTTMHVGGVQVNIYAHYPTKKNVDVQCDDSDLDVHNEVKVMRKRQKQDVAQLEKLLWFRDEFRKG
jgi:hypothetical protein